MATQSCPGQGDGVTVPGSSDANVLAMCTGARTIEELSDDDDDLSAAPPLIITLDSDQACGGENPGNSADIHDWYRAFPLASIGEF
jgi:hypothetical protein